MRGDIRRQMLLDSHVRIQPVLRTYRSMGKINSARACPHSKQLPQVLPAAWLSRLPMRDSATTVHLFPHGTISPTPCHVRVPCTGEKVASTVSIVRISSRPQPI